MADCPFGDRWDHVGTETKLRSTGNAGLRQATSRIIDSANLAKPPPVREYG
jgi:hypothetical protein